MNILTFILPLIAVVLLSLPLGEVSFFGLLLIGIGFGPIFPSVLHSVPDRFGEEYSADITGDGEDDMITLYTSVQRDMSGELMWDDTQEWVLQAETAEGVYDLYDERIHGNAYMNVADFYNEDGDIKVISLIILLSPFQTGK